MAGKLVPIERRFWGKVEKGDGCWLWNGSKDVRGYGRIGAGGGGSAPLLAHRVAWELTRGPIPDRLVVCHRCDNPSCVNPDHLFLGSHKTNTQDAVQKGRMPRGERHYKAKLNEAAVLEIRRMGDRNVSMTHIGRIFGVDPETARDVVKRRKWKHVKEAS